MECISPPCLPVYRSLVSTSALDHTAGGTWVLLCSISRSGGPTLPACPLRYLQVAGGLPFGPCMLLFPPSRPSVRLLVRSCQLLVLSPTPLTIHYLSSFLPSSLLRLLPTSPSFLESFWPWPTWDFVLFCQTSEHVVTLHSLPKYPTALYHTGSLTFLSSHTLSRNAPRLLPIRPHQHSFQRVDRITLFPFL